MAEMCQTRADLASREPMASAATSSRSTVSPRQTAAMAQQPYWRRRAALMAGSAMEPAKSLWLPVGVVLMARGWEVASRIASRDRPGLVQYVFFYLVTRRVGGAEPDIGFRER